MTPEEIKKIAREVASKIEPKKGFGGESYWIRTSTEIIEKIVEDYCIVEKSKVLKEYDYYKNSWNETELTETIMESLEDIFGKELFNDKEK